MVLKSTLCVLIHTQNHKRKQENQGSLRLETQEYKGWEGQFGLESILKLGLVRLGKVRLGQVSPG